MPAPEPKPVKKNLPNPKLLTIAALVLIVLALLFMVTPLLRSSGSLPRAGTFVTQSGGQSVPQNGFAVQANGSTLPNPRIVVGGGIIGPIVYFIALLVSLAAAVGMVLTKRWGQALGILIAALYGLLGLVSLLPLLFVRLIGLRNPVSLILGLVHILMAIAVIVLASIPAKQTPAAAASKV